MNFASDFSGARTLPSVVMASVFPEVICEMPQHKSVFVVMFAFKYFSCIVSATWWYFVVGCFAICLAFFVWLVGWFIF